MDADGSGGGRRCQRSLCEEMGGPLSAGRRAGSARSFFSAAPRRQPDGAGAGGSDRAGRDRGTIGWEFVHIAVDDYSRLAYAEVLPDERATTAIAFLRRALVFFARYGIQVERVLTDNGSAYRS